MRFGSATVDALTGATERGKLARGLLCYESAIILTSSLVRFAMQPQTAMSEAVIQR